jgi:hypothetical protein
MRLRLLLLIAASAALASCDPQTAGKSGGAARAVIPTAPATLATDNCPKAPAPVCPGATAGKVRHGAAKSTARHKAAIHRASTRKAGAHRVRRYEALAGGPPAPAREYARVPQGGDYYARGERFDGPATSYRYGPVYPPAWRPDDRREERRRYDERSSGGTHYYRHGGAGAPLPPPAPDRYGPDRPSRSEEGAYGYDADREEPRSSSGYRERRTDERRILRYEERRSESSASHEEHSWSSQGGCCQGGGEAAGFDANGFLTWPGKVPARP